MKAKLPRRRSRGRGCGLPTATACRDGITVSAQAARLSRFVTGVSRSAELTDEAGRKPRQQIEQRDGERRLARHAEIREDVDEGPFAT
jgi:hypothetical protein